MTGQLSENIPLPMLQRSNNDPSQIEQDSGNDPSPSAEFSGENPLLTGQDTAAGENPPPNGGWMAWLQVMGGFLVIFNAQGLIQSYGVFQAFYEAVLLPENSPASIAWIGSFQVFLLFFMSIIVSPLIDRGHFRFCFSGGCSLMVLSILVTAWCHKFWHLLLVQGILLGIGMGTVFGSGALVLQSYFTTNIGIAAGFTSAGGSVGGMVYPAMAEHLVVKVGFSNTLRIFAGLAASTMIVAIFLVRERTDIIKRKPHMDWDMLSDVPFLLMSVGLFFTFWGIYFSFYFIVAYAQSRLHLDNQASITLLILMNATNLSGRLLPSLLSDRLLGPVNTIIPCIFLTALLLFLWIAATTEPAITAIACFYGLFSGGVQGLYNPVIWAFPADNTAKSRVRVAFVFLCISAAALTGTPIGGAIIKREKGDYLGAQLFAAMTVLLGGCLMVLARYAKAGWRVVKL